MRPPDSGGLALPALGLVALVQCHVLLEGNSALQREPLSGYVWLRIDAFEQISTNLDAI